jgi:hypothetical protein
LIKKIKSSKLKFRQGNCRAFLSIQVVDTHLKDYGVSHLILLRNRLSPRFINKATTVEPIQYDEGTLVQADQEKKRKTKTCHRRHQNETEVKPELHNDTSKKVRMQCVTVAETETVKGFHPESYVERVPATTPPRGFRYPQASPSLALKRRAFARKKTFTPRSVSQTVQCPRVRFPEHNLGADIAEAPPTPGSPAARSSSSR